MPEATTKYEDLSRQDIWAMAKDPNLGQSLRKLPNGKFRRNMVATARTDTPWAHNTITMDRACDLWHEVYFQQFSFVPRGCRNCWKISMTLSSVYDLFLLREFQKTHLEWEGKCGVDQRRYTPARYAGFWYVPMGFSLEEARAYYETILTHLKEEFEPYVVAPWKIILKRGCTEMEQHSRRDCGVASDKWDELFSKSDPLEDCLNEVFEADDPAIHEIAQNPSVAIHIERFWIEWAFAIGDATVWLLDSEKTLLDKNPSMLAYEAYDAGMSARIEECLTK